MAREHAHMAKQTNHMAKETYNTPALENAFYGKRTRSMAQEHAHLDIAPRLTTPRMLLLNFGLQGLHQFALCKRTHSIVREHISW